MTRITFSLLLALIMTATAHAYHGRTTVTKKTEGKHGVHFVVTFQEHDSMLFVTVIAPKAVKMHPLSHFAAIQIENDKTTLRVPLSNVHLTGVADKSGKLTVTPQDVNPKVSFSVSQRKLADTQLEVRYSTGKGIENNWTYVVDLATYQSIKDVTLQFF